MIDFMILGAQKAATSTLHESLRNVENIYLPREELGLFEEPEFGRGDWQRFGKDCASSTKKGIKRPDNFCDHRLIDRISNNVRDVKYIVVLREPVSRAISSYYHYQRHGHLPVMPLNIGMTRCIEMYRSRSEGIEKYVIQNGMYGECLTKWFSYFSPEDFLILSDKDVIENLESSVRRCCRHIGVEYTSSTEQLIMQKNKGYYNPYLVKLIRVGQKLKTREVQGGKRRERRKGLLRYLFGNGLISVARIADLFLDNTPEQLSQEVRGTLEDIYRKDLVALEKLVPKETLYWANIQTKEREPYLRK